MKSMMVIPGLFLASFLGVGTVWFYDRQKLFEAGVISFMALATALFIMVDCEIDDDLEEDRQHALRVKTVWRPETNSYHI